MPFGIEELQTRHFLFLQGNSSRLFAKLRRSLLARGHRVHRINFCCADHVFWGSLRNCSRFVGTLDEWPRHLSDVFEAQGITDVILFGDCRPYHRIAVELARRSGVTTHVFEEGYLRPNWITLERGGVNGFSSLSRDPRSFLADAPRLPPQVAETAVAQSFAERVALDLAFHVANAPTRLLYPRFQRHRPASPLREAVGWARRLARSGRERRLTEAAMARLATESGRRFLFPLQLDADSQIRAHSSFAAVGEACAAVLRSFAAHAPQNSRLVVKLHPLDNGLVNYRSLIDALARGLGVAAKVTFTDGGDLGAMIEGSSGVVVVNSTVGLMALRQDRPVKCLGRAIYDLAGMTHQDSLDSFWTAPSPPDARLVAAFSRVLVSERQINGGFFGSKSLELAVAGILARLLGPEVRRRAAPALVQPERRPAVEVVEYQC